MSNETKLDRFIESFKTEAELRTAVVGLLERMPNTKNVRRTHGPREIGKDAVFHWVGPFDQRQLVACVVKNQKITGSAETDDGARAVYHQAEQSLDTPVPRVADGSDEFVSQVFVICPYECPPATVDSIKGKLQARRGQVTFLCGRELLEKFEDHYPEFLVFQSALYGSYVADLQKRLDSDPAVMNVLFLHGFMSGPRMLTELYVRPKFSRELHRHQIHKSVLEVEHLLRSLDLEEAENLQKSFRDIGRLVIATTMPDEEGSSLGVQFQQIADRIRHSWQAAFEVHHRRTDIPIDERHKPRNVVSVALRDAEELKGLARELLSRASSTLQNFDKTLSSANRCVEHRFPNVLAALESSLLLDYCEVEGVSRQVPSIVLMKATADQAWELDEDLIFSSTADLFITGPAGFGKTSFCKWQTLDELTKFRESQSGTIPIYVPLHQFAHGDLGSFESTFLRAPELIALWNRRREHGANGETSFRFRLYLDGIDEVTSIQRQQSLLELALKGKECEPTMSIIVTGREHVVGAHLRHFVRIRVREFDDKQVKDLASKWFGNDESSIKQFFSQMERVPTLRPLMRVPLLATLILGVYRNTKTLPQSRVSLYEMFVSLLAGGWDIAKNIQREAVFGPAPKLTVLTKLAASLHLNRKRDCTQQDFKNAVMHTLPGLRSQWQQILEETVHDGLLIPVGLDYAFAHLSFQEYLAAKDLFEPNGRKASLAFRNFLGGDDWWREVVIFYIGFSTDPKEIEEFIRKSAHGVLSKTATDTVNSRAQFLLEVLIMSFPGAELGLSV